jgi:hypothetical protein
MNTTHTPGPWRVDGQELISGLSDSRPLLHAVIRSTDERWTSLVETECAEGHANARLIASAPDLLAALERLRDELDARTHRDGEMITASFVRGDVCAVKTLNAARAAIKKARGE